MYIVAFMIYIFFIFILHFKFYFSIASPNQTLSLLTQSAKRYKAGFEGCMCLSFRGMKKDWAFKELADP